MPKIIVPFLNGYPSVFFRSRDLTGANIPDANLARLDLRGFKFGDAILSRARFDHSDLRGVYLTNATARHASFLLANLAGACLKGADMKGTDFRHAHMTSASFAGANLREADFRGVTFDKMPVFKNADLHGAIFSLKHDWLREYHPKAIFKN